MEQEVALKKPKSRILALDILRGITVAGMIMVNNPGSWGAIYAPLEHASWLGLTPTDLVFPFFMFIMGISTYISMRKYKFEYSHATLVKIVRRTIVIFLIGMAIAWFSRLCYGLYRADSALPLGQRILDAANSFSTLRILGVMPRLALCYCACAIVAIAVKHKFIPWIIAGILVVYGALLLMFNGLDFSLDNTGQCPDPNTSSRATFATSIKTVFTNSVLALLFCIIFLSNFGYGAFDPLESFFYRDVLHVGVEWMGWLSSASGVGAVLGAVVALRLPPHLVNLKMLLVALMSVGVGSLIYVGTPHVGVALVGQIVLGVAWGVVNPLHNTIVQTTTPLEQLGRVNSVMGFGNMFAGVAPLAIAPWLAATFGVQQTLVGAGMVVTAVPAALLPPPTQAIR